MLLNLNLNIKSFFPHGTCKSIHEVRSNKPNQSLYNKLGRFHALFRPDTTEVTF